MHFRNTEHAGIEASRHTFISWRHGEFHRKGLEPLQGRAPERSHPGGMGMAGARRAPDPKEGWLALYRKAGQQVKGRQDLDSFRRSNILPKKSLHPIIATAVWSNFILGKYETAVFRGVQGSRDRRARRQQDISRRISVRILRARRSIRAPAPWPT